jgi:hypothetical protein
LHAVRVTHLRRRGGGGGGGITEVLATM